MIKLLLLLSTLATVAVWTVEPTLGSVTATIFTVVFVLYFESKRLEKEMSQISSTNESVHKKK